jgi:hypothetical protein
MTQERLSHNLIETQILLSFTTPLIINHTSSYRVNFLDRVRYRSIFIIVIRTPNGVISVLIRWKVLYTLFFRLVEIVKEVVSLFLYQLQPKMNLIPSRYNHFIDYNSKYYRQVQQDTAKSFHDFFFPLLSKK